MANWTTLKAAVSALIKTNGNKEITGAILQSVLNNIISTVGQNFIFVGVANDLTNPGTHDGNVFYLAATPGVYANFSGIILNPGEVAILKNNASGWIKEIVGLANTKSISLLSAISGTNLNLIPKVDIDSSQIVPTNSKIVINSDGTVTITGTNNEQSYLRFIDYKKLAKWRGTTTKWKMYAVFKVNSVTASNPWIGIYCLGASTFATMNAPGIYVLSLDSPGDIPTPAENSVIGIGSPGNSTITSMNFEILSWGMIPLEMWDKTLLDYIKYGTPAASALFSAKSSVAENAKSLTVNELLKLVDEKQLYPINWISNSGGSITEKGHVVINANAIQAKMNVPSNVTVGNKYIMIANIYNLNWLSSECTGLALYNNSQQLISISKSSTEDYLKYSVFTATTSGTMQVLATGANVNNGSIVPAGTPLVEFDGGLLCISEWTQELEDLLANGVKKYIGGKVIPMTVFKALSDVDYTLPESSFKTIKVAKDKIRLVVNEPLILDYLNTQSATNVQIENTGTQLLISGTLPYTGVATPFVFFNIGYQVTQPLYATKPRTFVVIAKGKVTGTNIKEIYLVFNNGAAGLMVQDVTDNVETPFETMVEYTFQAGYTGNDQYVFMKHNPKNSGVNMTLNYVLDEYFMFEKVDGWNINDYLNNVENPIYIPIYASQGVATEDYVDNKDLQLRSDIANGTVKNAAEEKFISDVDMVIMYGQSLSVGGGATDDSTNKRRILSFPGGNNEWSSNLDITNPTQVANFYGSNLILLNTLTGLSYAPVNSAAIAWMERLEQENQIDLSTFDYQFLLSTPGLSGSSITGLKKGTSYYNRLLFSVQKGFELALKSGKTIKVPILFWVQGEADMAWTQAAYYAELKQLFIDLNNDIKAITKQSEDVKFVTYQTAPATTQSGYENSGASWAQLQLALEDNNVYSAAAMYQYVYSDIWHPADRAIIGHQLGIIAKRIVNDEKPYPVFYPKSHYIQNNGTDWVLSIEFNVPVPPMRFDISGDIWHNPNGKQPNFGFKLLNSSLIDIILSEPIIRRGNTLVIKCSENPTGAKLSYAINGHYGGGNLCDSQNIIVRNKNIDYVVDNFCVAFKDYII